MENATYTILLNSAIPISQENRSWNPFWTFFISCFTNFS